MSPTLSPQHVPSVYPIPAASASGVLLPISIRPYKIPLVLPFPLHPIPSHSEQSYEIQSSLVELGSLVRGEGVILGEERILFVEEVQVPFG